MIKKLVTKRLILRKPKLSDWGDILDGVSDIKVSGKTSNIPHPYYKKDAIWWIKDSIKKWNNKKSYSFVIELKSEKKVIGCIGLSKIDRFSGKATTGSWINCGYWRKGFITEAKLIVNEFAFNTLKLRKLDSEVYTDNIASYKTQLSMGYKYEGCKKKDTRSKATGKIKGVNFYSLFKKDWKKIEPKLRKKIEKFQ